MSYRSLFLSLLTRTRMLLPNIRQFSRYYYQRQSKSTISIYSGLGALAVTIAVVSKVSDTHSKETEHSTIIAGIWKKDLPVYSYDEVLKHSFDHDGDIWVTYKDGVYDITDFVSKHFGGDILLMAAGKAIDSYWTIYNVHNKKETHELLESMRIGNFDSKTAPKDEDLPLIDDQWKNEPKSRHPALGCSVKKPFNAETPLSMLIDRFYTPNDIFYVRNHFPVPPKVHPNEYRLTIINENFSDKPIELTLDDIKKLPLHTISATLQCAGNRRSNMSAIKQVCGFTCDINTISNAIWTGVLVSDVLKQTGLNFKQIKHVQFEGFDEDALGSCYGASIPIETAMNPQSDVLLAFKMNGEELPMDHGYPLRVIVPGTIGARSVKWLSRIILSSEESSSSWQRRDYKLFPANIDVNNVDFNSSQAMQEMPVQSAICSPMPGSSVKASDGVVNIRGYAYSGGGRAISRVDVSINGGKEWHTANLIHEPEQKYNRAWAWTLWEVTIAIPENYVGDLDLCCKALDSSCNTQPEKVETIWNFRGLSNNSWHHVPIKIVKE